jgi:hypothetical protein
MKEKWFKNSIGQSIASISILFVFVILSLGSLEGLYVVSEPTTKQLENGLTERTYYNAGYDKRFTGKQDKYGRWTGLVVIENMFAMNSSRNSRTEVNYIDGKMHGKAKFIYDDGQVHYSCYNYGYFVPCDKSAQINPKNISAFQIIQNKYPWFLLDMNNNGFEDEFVSEYLDTLETALSKYEFDESEFEDYYQEALDDVDGNVYDSIIYVNSLLSIYDGLELLKNSEFRMAVIDRYWSGETSTYNNIISTYPNYLLSVNEAGIGNIDFEIFCNKFDSVLTTFGELNVQDPVFLDSLDNRMYRAMEFIYSDEKSASLAMLSLKSSVMNSINRNIWNIFNPQLKQSLPYSSPSEVAAVVMSFMLFQFTEADIVKKAVKEAWFLRNGIAGLPNATTEFSENNSSTSVSIKGNIIEDGGANVTERGIVWATFYNPSLNEQIVNSGAGAGNFISTITGLTEGNTYYARSYATNSVGTAYGNCISFRAGISVGIEDFESDVFDLKIYPNPASEKATLSFHVKHSESMFLTIVNLNGQVVIEKELGKLPTGLNQVQVNLSKLRSGIYDCGLSNKSGKRISQKLMVAN